MQCKNCTTRKLSSEFPSDWHISKDCNHNSSWCTRCLITAFDITKVCPECHSNVDARTIIVLKSQLMAITQKEQFTHKQIVTTGASNSEQPFDVIVTMLDGESATFNVKKGTTISLLQGYIYERFNIPESFQQLVFLGLEIQANISGRNTTLGEYNINEGSVVQVMKLLLACDNQSSLKIIDFVLEWGWPRKGSRAFLDGICFVFKGKTLYNCVDYKNRFAVNGIAHSGNLMNNRLKIGRHIITVNLQELDARITHLVFVMCSFNVKSMANFISPAVKLYDTAHPDHQISEYSIVSAGDCKSIIMCCLSRTLQKGWRVYQLGLRSTGNVFKTKPILTKIQGLFNKRVI